MLEIRNALFLLTAICGPIASRGGRYKARLCSPVKFSSMEIPTLSELITDQGFVYTPHNVTTEDGHILALHRISRADPNSEPGFPVLLINGFVFQSEGWLALGGSSLPFILANLGYDVWLGDVRGSTRSLGHTRYGRNDIRNYNYTIHEMGIYDLPAFIDAILLESERNHLLYVGYSMSGAILTVMNSERPKVQDKLLGAVLLSPVGYMRKWKLNSKELLGFLTSVDMMIEDHIKRGGWLLFSDIDALKRNLTACPTKINWTCKLLNLERATRKKSLLMRLYYQYAMTLTSASVFVAKHLFQLIKHGRLCKYDYGREANLMLYGSKVPPDYRYNLTRIPILLMCAGKDEMVPKTEALRTARSMNVGSTKFIRSFAHYDYIFSKNAPRLVYEHIVDYFDNLIATSPTYSDSNLPRYLLQQPSLRSTYISHQLLPMIQNFLKTVVDMFSSSNGS